MDEKYANFDNLSPEKQKAIKKEHFKNLKRVGMGKRLRYDDFWRYSKGLDIDEDLLYYDPGVWYRKQSKRNARKASIMQHELLSDNELMDKGDTFERVSDSESDEEPVVIVPKKNKKGKREYTPEQKKALVDRLKKGRERARKMRAEKNYYDKKKKNLKEKAKKSNKALTHKTPIPYPPKDDDENKIEEKPAEIKKKEEPKESIKIKVEERQVNKEPVKKVEPEYVRVNVSEYKKTMEEIDQRWQNRFNEFKSKYDTQKSVQEKPAPKPVNKPIQQAKPVPIPKRRLGRFNSPMW